MTIEGYKRLTVLLSSTVVLLIILLVGNISCTGLKQSRIQNELRHARDKVEWFDRMRAGATNSDLRTAARCLYEVTVMQNRTNASLYQHSVLEFFIERERQRAVKDIIAALRDRTRDNLGSDPIKWIEEYSK
jgi:hypothetical protein